MAFLTFSIIAQTAIGAAASAILFVAQLQTASASDATTIVTGGAFMSMTTFLVYLVKRMADGGLVPVDIVKLLDDKDRKIAAHEVAQEKLLEVLERAHERETTYHNLFFTNRHDGDTPR